jgi:hypothetical protein
MQEHPVDLRNNSWHGHNWFRFGEPATPATNPPTPCGDYKNPTLTYSSKSYCVCPANKKQDSEPTWINNDQGYKFFCNAKTN